MTRAQLEHAIRAACDVSGDTEVWVFGSQAILGEHPDAPDALRQSVEADIAPKNPSGARDLHRCGTRRAVAVPRNARLLRARRSHRERGASRGVGVLDVSPAEPEHRGVRRLLLEGHDLAASKLAAFRDKDRDFVRVLLAEGLIEAGVLLERITWMDVEPGLRDRMERWVRAIRAEL